MSNASTTTTSLLDELLALPLDQRLERVRSGSPDDGTSPLSELIDEAAQRTSVSAASALQATEMVVGLADALEHPATRVKARRARARALSYAGRFSEALTVCQQAIDIAEKSGEIVEGGRVRLAMMHPLCVLGRLDEAAAIGERARQMFVDVDEPELAGRADINLGITWHRADNPRQAVECFDRARPLLTDDPTLIGSLENSRGEALVAVNDFEGAEQAFSAALQHFDASGHALNAGIAEGNLADLAYRQGRLHLALERFERARRRLSAAELAIHRSRLLAEEADANAMLGLPAVALNCYESALNQLDETGLVLEAARARMGMGQTLLALNRLAEAETALAAAANAFSELGHQTLRARTDLFRAALGLRRGLHDDAATLASRALAVLQKRPADAAAARLMLASIYMAMGRDQLADAELSAGLAIAGELDLAPLLADLHHMRGRLLRKQQRYDEATDAFRDAVAQVERVRGALQAERFRAAFLSDRSTLYEDLLATLLDRHTDDAVIEAFAVAELARSRSLLDLVRGAIDVDVVESIGDAEQSETDIHRDHQRIRSELNALYSRLGDAEIDPEQTEGVNQQWREAVRQREMQLQSLENRISAVRGSAGLFARPVSLHQLQQVLTPQQVVLEYVSVNGRVQVFAIDRNSCTVIRDISGMSDVMDHLQRLQFQIDRALRPGIAASRMDRLTGDAQHELAWLYDQLLRPVEQALDGKQVLTIVPHGPLHLVPFNALYDGNQYLIETFSVHTTPSASVYENLSAREDVVDDRFLVVGVGDRHAPGIEDEAKTVAKALACGADDVLIGSDATADRVTGAMPAASVMHLACHARFAIDSPMGSGLRVYGQWLTVRDIYRLRLAANLITLSGCETGLSDVAAGDELTGLVRSFLAIGARRLIVSLWRVSDETTSEFMRDFYRMWGMVTSEEREPADLLRRTQLSMMENHPHPAFWAPFMLVGKR